MKRGHNELVGLQVTISRVLPRYRLIHHYRWRRNGQTETTGTMRGFDMHRHVHSAEILRSLREAYAPAILSIWQQVTKTGATEYYQFQIDASPASLGFEGHWEHWAQW